MHSWWGWCHSESFWILGGHQIAYVCGQILALSQRKVVSHKLRWDVVPTLEASVLSHRVLESGGPLKEKLHEMLQGHCPWKRLRPLLWDPLLVHTGGCSRKKKDGPFSATLVVVLLVHSLPLTHAATILWWGQRTFIRTPEPPKLGLNKIFPL